jgi:hypothetical protein
MNKEIINKLNVKNSYYFDNMEHLYPEGCEVFPLQESGLVSKTSIFVKYPIKKEQDVYKDSNNNILFTKDLFGLDTYAKKKALLKHFTINELLEVYNIAKSKFSFGERFHPVNKITLIQNLNSESIINGNPYFEKELHGDQYVYILRWSANVWVHGVWAIPTSIEKNNYSII